MGQRLITYKENYRNKRGALVVETVDGGMDKAWVANTDREEALFRNIVEALRWDEDAGDIRYFFNKFKMDDVDGK